MNPWKQNPDPFSAQNHSFLLFVLSLTKRPSWGQSVRQHRLLSEYDNLSQFKEYFYRHLVQTVNDNEYFKKKPGIGTNTIPTLPNIMEQKAIEVFQKQIREYEHLEGLSGSTYFYLGCAYTDQGQKAKALEAFELHSTHMSMRATLPTVSLPFSNSS